MARKPFQSSIFSEAKFIASLDEAPQPVIQLHKAKGYRLSKSNEAEALAIIKKHSAEPDVNRVVPKFFRPVMARTTIAIFGNGDANPPTEFKTVPVPRVKGTYFNARQRVKQPEDIKAQRIALRAERRVAHEDNFKVNLLASMIGGFA